MAFCGYLKQSTTVTIQLGPFVDDGDGKTAEEGLTIEDTDIELSKNGGAFAAPNDTNNAAHDSAGYYTKQLNGTDTGTLGILTVECHESGALPVRQDYQVVVAHWWDTMCSTDLLHVDVHAIDDDDAAANNLESACDNYSVTRGLAGTALPAAAADAAGGLPISDAGELDLDAQIGTDIDAILEDTGDLQSNQGAWATATGFSTHSAADAADAVWNEASAGHTDAGKAGQQLWTDVDAILTDTGELQTDDVPGLIGALNDPTAAAIVNEWETQSQADPTGFHVNVMEVNGTAQTANDNSADINAILKDTGTDGVVVASINNNAVSAAAIATGAIDADALKADAIDEIWDEVMENSKTARQYMNIIKAFAAGKVSGGGTTTITFRNDADDGDRITATVDSNGNRSAVTVDGS